MKCEPEYMWKEMAELYYFTVISRRDQQMEQPPRNRIGNERMT